jgi:hypothetical protein
MLDRDDGMSFRGAIFLTITAYSAATSLAAYSRSPPFIEDLAFLGDKYNVLKNDGHPFL